MNGCAEPEDKNRHCAAAFMWLLFYGLPDLFVCSQIMEMLKYFLLSNILFLVCV